MANNKDRRTRIQRDDDELEMAYRRISGSRGKPKYAKKSNRTAAIAAICATIVAITIGIAAGCIYFLNADQNGIIIQNVYVAGVDVGGMTQAEAIEAVQKATAGTYSQATMIVKVLDSQAEIPSSCVGTFDIKGAVKAAYKFGNSGSKSKRQKEQQIAINYGYTVNLESYLNLNEKSIRAILSELGSNYSTALSQSTYEVTGAKPNQTLVIHLGVPEYGLDLQKLYQQVIDAYSQNVFLVEGTCDMIEPDPVNLESIHSKYYIAPKNASFDPKTFAPIEGTDGYGFDIEKAEEKILNAQYGSTIEIPFSIIKPTITVENLVTVLFRDSLATYTAVYDSNFDRDTNLRLACEAINGLILYPGEVFSYNNALGERTPEKGYRLGPSFSGDKTVMTYGGGICQVSSALYHCTLVAEMDILVRKNHGFAPLYVPLGMDATVSWGSIDFRFRNSSEFPIRIDAFAEGGNVTITLVGTDDKDYYTELEYEILSTENYTVSYQTMSADNQQGYQNGDYIIEPYTGYHIKTYRCKYDKETMTLLSRDYIEQSVYKKRDGVICRIEGSPSGIGGGSVTDENGSLPE